MISARQLIFVALVACALASAEEVVALAEEVVSLGTAGNYAILTKTGISTVPTSAITGDIGVSPIAATAITGFGLSLVADGTYSTSTQLDATSKATSASYGGAVATALTAAVGFMEAAYTDAAGRLNPKAGRINIGTGILGVDGQNGGTSAKFTPGVYTWGSDVTVKDTIYFDGGATDVFIMQIAGNLIQVVGVQMELSGGAKAENIFWQVSGFVTMAPGAHAEGILLVKTRVDFLAGSSLNGRVLSQTACNLQLATITQP
jgi:hypothetical protein